jgi:hypothetical protein
MSCALDGASYIAMAKAKSSTDRLVNLPQKFVRKRGFGESEEHSH